MAESSFQFTTPILLYAQIAVNQAFKNEQEIPFPMVFSVETVQQGEREATVELTAKLGGDTDEYPYQIIVKEGARFRWTKESDDKKDWLLKYNAPALLLSYLRPIVANLTAASPFTSFSIPFIDFTKDDPSIVRTVTNG